ncbi:aggregation-promoting factor C-terminal-like domain-containing protein [Apilactobacillus timberlakei]|uniref:aggregation-promoting factor C-terminal-like domain-containing protein n=1 Tax=Apilactobacillus timberlakei TaxID=2008380 RepID=UPI00112E81EA|nr:aggregation promoting protein [Apilactobacillus timberlakei]TPR16275.1 aggregation promoting protein [Apilactobacillus timberlakei]TPR21554.1 aggregation promoting protein [Apilactobacillus timberlakei]
MKQFNSLSKVGITLMSTLMFTPLLMGNVSTNAAQRNTSNTVSDVQNTNNDTNVSSTTDANNKNINNDSGSSASSNNGTTNTFNVPNSNSVNDNDFADELSSTSTSPYIKKHFYDNLSPANRAAKWWIASHESSFNYNANGGKHYGRFQLTRSYLHGNYSKINQEKTADRYVEHKYGSWTKAKAAWLAHAREGGAMKYGWYSMNN